MGSRIPGFSTDNHCVTRCGPPVGVATASYTMKNFFFIRSSLIIRKRFHEIRCGMKVNWATKIAISFLGPGVKKVENPCRTLSANITL